MTKQDDGLKIDIGNNNKTRRRLIKYSGVGLTSGLLAGCVGDDSDQGDQEGNSPQQGGKLTIAAPYEPDTLNPADSLFSPVELNIFDTLAGLKVEGNEVSLEPRILTDWEMEDNTTFIGDVREGMQFHGDWGELTAEDIAFIINFIVENQEPRIFLFQGRVAGAEVIDDYTVQINLADIYVPFERTVLINMPIPSKEAYQEKGREGSDRDPIGTGPFSLEEWVAGDNIALRKHDGHWREGYPYVDEIEFRVIPDQSTQLDLLEAGEADILHRAPFNEVSNLKQRDDLKLKVQTPEWCFDYFIIGGATPKNEALNNQKVRQAIQYAIDRESIAENGYFGYATPDDDPLPSTYNNQLADGDIQMYPTTSDPDKASELLEEAGYEDGLELELITPNQSKFVRAVQIIQSNLSDVNIDVQIQTMDTNTHWSTTFEGNFDMSYVNLTIVSSDADAAFHWFYHSEGVANWFGMENERVDELLEEQRATLDGAKRSEMLSEVLDIALENAHPGYTVQYDLIRVLKQNVYLERESFSPKEHLWELYDVWKE